MAINKETKSFGLPWERQYGYSQMVKVGMTIYLSGEVSHDDNGDTVSRDDIEAQMRQAYTNIRNCSNGRVPKWKTWFVTDTNKAFDAAVKCRKEIFSGPRLLQVPSYWVCNNWYPMNMSILLAI